MRNGLARGMKRRYGWGGRLKWQLTLEEKFLEQLDFADKTVIDIGGYIGITTLFFARAAGAGGRVVVFEPNPENCAELLFNVQLNNLNNVQLIPIGLGDKTGHLTMLVDPVYPSRGSFAADFQQQVFDQRARSIEVEIDTLDHQITERQLPVPDFIKIDVEGFEHQVLGGMAHTLERYRPELLIEIHGCLKRKIIEDLIPYGYRIYRIESQSSIALDNIPEVRGGHLFAYPP